MIPAIPRPPADSDSDSTPPSLAVPSLAPPSVAPASADPAAPATDRRRLLRTMVLIRTFEERLLKLFAEGVLMGTTHTSIGQEGNAVGVLAAARPTDLVVSNHRGHGHFLAHVGNLGGLMAELMGRATGVCGGIGGSQHLCAEGRFFSNGVQGGIAPLATGLALAEKRRGRENIVFAFLGDGTLGQGVVYESFNLASLWGAPVLFVVEHNGIAQTTPTELAQVGDFCARARAFGLRSAALVHPSIDEILDGAAGAAAHVRSRSQPFLLLIRTQRLAAHSKGDDTRSAAEVEALRAFDPLPRLAAELGAEELDSALRQAGAAVEAAYQAAAAAPLPTLGSGSVSPVAATLTQTATVGVDSPLTSLADPLARERARSTLERIAGRSVLEQLNRTLHRLFQSRDEVLLIGEDVLDPYGGAFKVARGLSSAFPQRVLTTPISEAGMVGVAAGMALRGWRPIVEIMFGDFVTLCADQIINHAAKYPLMYNRQVTVPLVIRTPMGGRRGYGPTHSQTLERLFFGVPGLRVLAPSHLHDCGALLEAAVADDGPVLFVENKLLYARRVQPDGYSLVDDFELRLLGDQAPVCCLSLTGFDAEAVTLYAYGGMAPLAMEAARRLLLEEEVAVRLVFPSEIHPLGRAACVAAWAEGSRVVTAEEAQAPSGFGAEVIATLAEAGCRMGRVARVGSKPLAIACSRGLEQQILPQADDLVAAVLGTLR